MHVALIAPAHEVLAGKIGGAEFRVAGPVVGIPRLLLLGRNPRRQRQLRVAVGKGLRNRHVLVTHGDAPPRIIVEQRRGLGIHAVLVEAQVAQRRRPFAVRRLVLAHQHERLRLVPVLEPLQRDIADDVGHIARHRDLLAHFDHRRVIIDALARENLPKIKARWIGAEMPLADDRRLVAGLLEQLGKRLLRAVERGVRVVGKPVQVAVFSGEDGRARRAADRVGHETAVKAHALFREAVDVRGIEQLARVAVGADGLVGVIVGKNKDDVRRFRGAGGTCEGGNREKAKQEESHRLDGGRSILCEPERGAVEPTIRPQPDCPRTDQNANAEARLRRRHAGVRNSATIWARVA